MLWYMYANEMKIISPKFQSRYQGEQVGSARVSKRESVLFKMSVPKESSLAREAVEMNGG